MAKLDEPISIIQQQQQKQKQPDVSIIALSWSTICTAVYSMLAKKI
jgi:hypothetical protein